MAALLFDDTTGQVSGTWVLGRPPAAKPGSCFYIMVVSVASTVDIVVTHGGEIVQPIGADAPEITARFRDTWENPSSATQDARLHDGSRGKTQAAATMNLECARYIVPLHRTRRVL